MRLEVLVSCMNQTDMSILKRTGITSDALIINQCGRDGFDRTTVRGRAARMISTTARGLSKSRNMALANAEGDICLLCDDDERFVRAYEKIICGAFLRIPDADLIAFDIANQPCRLKKRAQRLKRLQLLRVSSWQIAFRRESVISAGVRFDEYMGAGTGNGAQEENKFLLDCERSGLKIYYVPIAIGSVAQAHSTWFAGFTEDFFYKRGTATRYMLGLPLAVLYAGYYLAAKRRLYRGEISVGRAAVAVLKGIVSNDIAGQKAAALKDGGENTRP